MYILQKNKSNKMAFFNYKFVINSFLILINGNIYKIKIVWILKNQLNIAFLLKMSNLKLYFGD